MSANNSGRDGSDGSDWPGTNDYDVATFVPPFGGFSLHPSTGSAGARQIVFIDGSVPDAHLLAAGVKPGVIAVVLDPAGNELAEMAAYLASQHLSGLAAIDIVAHGADGVLKLGTSELSAATINTYAPQLAEIGAALAPGGAIQLYGCDVAQDAAGVAFLQQLSQATGGADIAAASHLVGAAAGGGSWTLNVDVGAVNVGAPFTASTLADYQGELSSAATGNLWLGSWNGLDDSNLNQLDELSVSGSTVLSTTDVADTLKPGDGNLDAIDSLAIDPATGKAFILGPNQIGSNGNISYVPTSGGAYTSLYSAPDTGEGSSETGFIGEIRVDEQNSTIFFTQSDFNADSGAQYTADTGVFVIPETGGAPTQVINDITGGTTLYNPTSMELDLPDNLVFFVDNDTFTGGAGTAELYVGSLANHNYEALLTLPLSGTLNPNFEVTTALAIDTADHIIYFSTYQPANPGYSGFAGIYSVAYTPNGTSTTIGTTQTLYLGAAAQVPDALAVDPANGLLYVSGTTYGNSGSSDAASAWVGSTSGSGSLSEIFQLGGQTLDDFSYTTAAAFEATPSLTASGTVTFVPGGAAVTLDSALTVTDESEPDLASATVSIVGLVSGDTLTVGTPGGLSESFSSGTLTLTGVASLATYQTALDSVAFATTSTSAGTRTIDWTVSDGVISSATPTTTVDVHAAPTLTAGATETFDGGGAAVTLDAGLAISDPSSTTLQNATLVIGGFITGDLLDFTNQSGITGSYNGGTGTLTLSGSASLAQYQTALDSITYSFNPGDGDPTGGGSHTSRTIAWVVNDGVASSATADSTLGVVHVAPSVIAGATETYEPHSAPVTLDPTVSVSDPDSGGTLSGATVSIDSGFLAGDTLNFSGQNGIAGSYDSSNGLLTLTGSASIADYQGALQSITYSFSGDASHGGTDLARTINWVVTDGVDSSALVTSSLDTPCFLRGTRILTPAGEVPVETLKPGDLVRTVRGAARPIRWVGFGRTLVTPRNRNRATPVIVRRHALAEGVPYRDLYITRGHALYFEDVLVPVEELINHRSIAWDENARVIEFYHVELDSHDVIIAERAATESYREDGNSPLFHNVGTRPATLPMQPCMPVLHEHPTVKRIWRKLSDRAGRLDLAFTEDPDLHLRADGVRLDTEDAANRVWRFRVENPVDDLRIVSRSAIPAMIGLDQDQRQLGVALRRIVLRRPGLTMDIGWDEPRLQDGFHDPEPAEQHRWTDGEAVLPPALLAPLGGGTDVELHVTGLLPYPLAVPALPLPAGAARKPSTRAA